MVAGRRVVLAAAALALVGGATVYLVPRLFGSCETPADADRVVAVLKADPILTFRPAGATLQDSTATEGNECSTLGETSSDASSVLQQYSVDGDLTVVVESYLAPAQAAGWQVRLVACSRSMRRVRLLMTKDVGATTVQLSVLGVDPYPPERPSVAVSVSDGRESFEPHPDEAAGGLHCVRPVRAGDPGLRPFSNAPARTAADLCGLLTINDLQNQRIAATRAVPTVEADVPVCSYELSSDDRVLALRDVSTDAAAFYEDRRLPTPAPGDDTLFFVMDQVDGVRAGMWIATAKGPVLLEAGRETDAAVLALGAVVRARAAAAAGTTTVASPRTTPCPPGVRC